MIQRKEKMDACREILSRQDGEHWTIRRFTNLAIDELCERLGVHNGHGPHGTPPKKHPKGRSPGSRN